MRAAAENLATVTLELGGKSPAIVHEDARLKEAARRIAFGKFLNNGQTCIAPDYLVVHESIKDEFLSLLKDEVIRIFSTGGSIEQSKNYGRIASEKHFNRLSVFLDDALKQGWKAVLDGPRDASSRFFHPYILTGSEGDTAILHEEIFGPILPVLTYKDINAALLKINQQPKPLSLYVFSASRQFCESVAKQTSSGSVGFNECLVQFLHPNIPFGGVNHSGMGNSHGFFGFQAFSNEKSVVRQKSGYATSYLFHPPYKSWFGRLMKILFRWF
jgi:aldehyde dehydrogenase (NAD+)